MSKIKCNKCGEKIKIKTIFLEEAGCENCGNRINFSTLDALSGVRAGLLFAVCAILAVVGFFAMMIYGVRFDQLPQLFLGMSVTATGLLLLVMIFVVLIVGTLEKWIGCHVYEQWRKREEELEKIAEKKRREDALRAEMECDNE